MLASSSRTSLQKIQSQFCYAATSRSQDHKFSLLNPPRRHYATQVTATEDEFVPSPHLLASRHRLSGFGSDRNVQRASPVTNGSLIKGLMIASNSGNWVQCLRIAAELKHSGHKPDISTYAALMHAAHHGAWFDAWAILEDMQAMGVEPDVNIFNGLIKSQYKCGTRQIWKLLDKMQELGVAPNATTYELVIRKYVDVSNMELALQYFWAMQEQNIVPELRTAQHLISFVAKSGYPRLALDLASWYEQVSVRRLEPVVWTNCMTASAKALYAPGVVQCWEKTVHELRLRPTEGLCMAILNTAARHSLPDLATDVIRVLKALGIAWQEFHLAPVFEAFCNKGDFKEALHILELMRKANASPVPETTRALSDAMANTESLDSVWGIIDELRAGGVTVDITVLHAIIRASVKLGDLQRAIGAYKSLADYGLTADLAMFNYLLHGCVQASHRALGDLLLADMKAAQVKPDRETYDIVVSLCLTQNDYEDAFFYLEEAKAAGFHISGQIYEMLIKKCIGNKDPRYKVAVEEMKEEGHELTPGLRNMIQKAAHAEKQTKSSEPREGSASSNPDAIHDAVKQFIESGGVDGVGELPKEYFRQ